MKMRAKDMFFDFLETIFSIVLVLFFIFYLFFWDHFDLAEKIFKTAGVLSIIGLFLVFKIRLSREKMKKYEKEGNNDILNYLEKKDIRNDRIVVLFISLVVLFIPLFFDSLIFFDVVQSLTVMFFMFTMHLIIFSKREGNQEIVIVTKNDETKDSLVIFFIPIILLVESLFVGGVNLSDYFQIFVAFIGFNLWHQYLFKVKSWFL